MHTRLMAAVAVGAAVGAAVVEDSSSYCLVSDDVSFEVLEKRHRLESSRLDVEAQDVEVGVETVNSEVLDHVLSDVMRTAHNY